MSAEHFRGFTGYWVNLDANLFAFACSFNLLMIHLKTGHNANVKKLKKKQNVSFKASFFIKKYVFLHRSFCRIYYK